jgi:hypothetical protein
MKIQHKAQKYQGPVAITFPGRSVPFRSVFARPVSPLVNSLDARGWYLRGFSSCLAAATGSARFTGTSSPSIPLSRRASRRPRTALSCWRAGCLSRSAAHGLSPAITTTCGGCRPATCEWLGAVTGGAARRPVHVARASWAAGHRQGRGLPAAVAAFLAGARGPGRDAGGPRNTAPAVYPLSAPSMRRMRQDSKFWSAVRC